MWCKFTAPSAECVFAKTKPIASGCTPAKRGTEKTEPLDRDRSNQNAHFDCLCVAKSKTKQNETKLLLVSVYFTACAELRKYLLRARTVESTRWDFSKPTLNLHWELGKCIAHKGSRVAVGARQGIIHYNARHTGTYYSLQ